MSKLSILFDATELVASLGAGAVVANLVKATTPDDLGKLGKVAVGIGSYTIGAVLGDMSARYVRKELEAIADKLRPSKQTDDQI